MRISHVAQWQLPVLTLFALLLLNACGEQAAVYNSFADYPVYSGDDLGVSWTAEATTFRVWAPTARKVRVNIYAQALGNEPEETHFMTAGENGTWTLELAGDWAGKFYTFQTKYRAGKDYHIENFRNEVPSPYATAVGTNGMRGAIVDMRTTDPQNWEADQRPALAAFSDIVLYELHLRDLAMHHSSGMQNAGTFMGLSESETLSPDSLPTGMDHLRELGVTHVHLLPVFDFQSIDESKLEHPAYNWGYDPQNYNVPEGSYSSDPWAAATRIREFKMMVQSLHAHGLRVVMDVVFNHTAASETSAFNQLVPGYYYRQNADSSWSNASACGNETASERAMVRKFIVASVVYWATEYHIDGFRFDLMGIHDLETMQAVRAALDEVDPTIFVYGEGWTAGESPLPKAQRALKANMQALPGIAAFNDDLRDGIKGHWSEKSDQGFVSGRDSVRADIHFGVVAAVAHPGVDMQAVRLSDKAWASAPTQSIQYVSCHDDLTLWDKLAAANPQASDAERIKMHKLALAIVMTSQGIPFLHAGVEMARTKGGNDNSFNAPDSVNAIDWHRKKHFADIFAYCKGLTALRKFHPAFRMPTAELLRQHLKFRDAELPGSLVCFELVDHANGDPWERILVAYNGAARPQSIRLPKGETWRQVLDGQTVDPYGIGKVSGKLTLPGTTAAVLYYNSPSSTL